MFYDQCIGPNVILEDFAAGLYTMMVKVVNLREMPGGEAGPAWDMSQAMDTSHTWHAAEAKIKTYQSWKLSDQNP